MFRRFGDCCLKLWRDVDESSFEDFVDEDLIGKPEGMTHARWRTRSGEDELVLVALQVGNSRLPPSAPEVYGEIVSKVNDAWIIRTTAEVHAPPATMDEQEDLPPPPSRRRVCGRRWAQKIAARTVVRPRVGRAHRFSGR